MITCVPANAQIRTNDIEPIYKQTKIPEILHLADLFAVFCIGDFS